MLECYCESIFTSFGLSCTISDKLFQATWLDVLSSGIENTEYRVQVLVVTEDRIRVTRSYVRGLTSQNLRM